MEHEINLSKSKDLIDKIRAHGCISVCLGGTRLATAFGGRTGIIRYCQIIEGTP